MEATATKLISSLFSFTTKYSNAEYFEFIRLNIRSFGCYTDRKLIEYIVKRGALPFTLLRIDKIAAIVLCMINLLLSIIHLLFSICYIHACIYFDAMNIKLIISNFIEWDSGASNFSSKNSFLVKIEANEFNTLL